MTRVGMALTAALASMLAALLLFMPVTSLVWSVALQRSAIESAFVVMWSALGILGVFVAGLAYRFSHHAPGWPNVGRFVAAGFVFSLIACIGAIAVASNIRAVDSSHGGSIGVLVLGCAGIVMAGTAWLLFVTRAKSR